MSRLKKRPDGYYCAWYKGKQFTGKTEKEALQKRDKYKYECKSGASQLTPITVSDLVEKWLPVSKANASAQTYNQYTSVMEKLTDTIGDKYMSAVKPEDIKRVWMAYTGLSQSYINKGKFLYKSFFQHAVDNNYCAANPMLAESAKPHKGTKGSHRCLTPSEVALIESVPHRCQAAAMFMLKAGIRRGEMLALERSDIHDDRIFITKAVKFVSNKPVVGDTKNESSERSVPLFAPLKPFYESMGRLLLPDDHGGLCTETAFVRAWESYLTDLSTYVNGVKKRWYHLTREWKESHPDEYANYLALKEKDKEEAEAYRLTGWKEISFRPHDLRHTFITACRDNGVDIHICMQWCGHTTERMILEIYDHPSEAREIKALEAMDNKKP